MIDLVAQAIVKKPLKYFSDNFNICFLRIYDVLDWYEGAVLDLSDQIEYALRRYNGHPEDTTTIYLPFELKNAEKITEKVLEILKIYNLTELDLEWQRKNGPEL